MNIFEKVVCSKAGYLVGGVLVGTVGKAILSSKDAKKLYTYCTAAALRGKDSIMETGTALKENCEDIYADAMDMNCERYAIEEQQMIENAKAVLDAYNVHTEAEEFTEKLADKTASKTPAKESETKTKKVSK